MPKNITKVHIHKFRKFEDIEITLGSKVTAIAGKNGTMKTTLLGIIGQAFSMNDENNSMCSQKTVDSAYFTTDLVDKFKFSPLKDVAGTHRWDVYFGNSNISDISPYPVNSIVRSNQTGGLRFWHASSRAKGSGFRTFPVIYLSLQRLSPLGETTKESFDTTSLSQNEKDFINSYYDKILCSTSNVIDTGILSASNKKSTITRETSEYDAYGISAGQDNVGKILLAVLSFKRLMENFPEQYYGGLLLIDELDATLYPAAQEKITECLFRFASDYKLQILFSTHSTYILKKLKEPKYKSDAKIVYLYERGGKVESHPNPTLSEMENHLNAVARKPEDIKKIKVYCEDDVGRNFTKSLLGKKITKLLQFDTQSVSAEHYHLFIDKSIQEFTSSIIILDGDKKVKSGRTPKKKNFVILPPNCLPAPTCPEKLFYNFLKNLSDADSFWSLELDGHTKDTCFRNFQQNSVNIDQYKSWYNEQKNYWGRGCSKLHKRWIDENPQETDRFVNDFRKANNELCEVLEYPLIEE